MDTWVSGPEFAWDRKLVFGINGRFSFLYSPVDLQKDSVRRTGAWRLKKGELQIKVGRSWQQVRVKRDDAGFVVKLKIDEEKMAGVYTRRPQE